MSRRTVWRVGFLSVTALALLLEVVAVADGDPDTDPWTTMIVQTVPMEATIAVIGALVLWLPVHFLRRYRQRRAAARDESRLWLTRTAEGNYTAVVPLLAGGAMTRREQDEQGLATTMREYEDLATGGRVQLDPAAPQTQQQLRDGQIREVTDEA